jgi:arsenate reductase
MQEAGIDISGHRSKSIDEFAEMDIDYAITVCDNAREECPYYTQANQLIHHSFRDPAAAQGSDQEILAEFRRVRDEIENWLDKAVITGLI